MNNGECNSEGKELENVWPSLPAGSVARSSLAIGSGDEMLALSEFIFYSGEEPRDSEVVNH